MSVKGKVFEFVILSFIKWALILILGGIVFYFVVPKYQILSSGERFNQVTGRIDGRI